MRNVLVIGGNGFIGSHLVDRLVVDDWSVSVIDIHERKFSKTPKNVAFYRKEFGESKADVYRTLENLKPDIVFHLAWKTIPLSPLKEPRNELIKNLIPSLILIEACAKLRIKIIFNSSGGAVYGNINSNFISEENVTNPISPYGLEKLLVEKYLHLYNNLYGLDYVTLRPSNPFGPRQNYLGNQGAIVIFMYRIAKGLPIIISGDGETIRDYFYISDLIEAYNICLNTNLFNQVIPVFNVSSGLGVSLNQIIKMLEELIEKKAIVKYSSERKFDPRMAVLDSSLIRETCNWSPKVKLLEGLQKTWQWMVNQI